MKVFARIVSSVAIVLIFVICIYALLVLSMQETVELKYTFLITILTAVFYIMLIKFLNNKIGFSIKTIIVCATLLVLCVGGWILYNEYEEHQNGIPTMEEIELNLLDYVPFEDNEKLVKLNAKAKLQINENFPKIDGATSFFPVYSAFVEAAYDEKTFTVANHTYASSYPDEIRGKILECTRTEQAYKNIVDKKADIVFVLAPSDEQLKYAEERNAKLKFIPIGKEAFVFFVNSQNEINSLTVSEIKDIYSGEITNWKDVGGKREKIKVFQRNKNSGSQTALENLMQGRTIVEAVKAEAMGVILDEVANYRNYNSAIGFSFRYFATEMEKNNNIKLLEVEGVYPSIETMENGTYPLINEFYAVVREDNDNENVDKFIDWVLSEEGQELVRKAGYAGI